MYIKQVTIHGFKSYRAETTIGPFDSGLNIIIGKNGSGKTSLLTAIQFVFSEKYAKLTFEELRSLLYEGQGCLVPCAQVEIVIDNTDGQFYDKNENVIIKREKGRKTDKYFINNKSVKHRDIILFFELSRIPILNDFFIVKQGLISKIAVSTDLQRLNIIKEIIGFVDHYPGHITAAKFKEDIDKKFSKLKKNLSVFHKHYDAINKQDRDANKFRKLEYHKRQIEYAIQIKKIKLFEEELREKTLEWKRLFQQQLEQCVHVRESEGKLQNVLNTIEKLKEDESDTRQRVNDLTLEKDNVNNRITKVELKKLHIKTEIDEIDAEKRKIEARLNELNDLMNNYNEIIQQKSVELTDVKVNEDKLHQEYEECQIRMQALCRKINSKDYFSNVQARDNWLNQRISQCERLIRGYQSSTSVLKKKIQEITRDAAECSDIIASKMIEKNKLLNEIRDFEIQLRNNQNKHVEMQKLVHDTLREQNQLVAELTHNQKEYDQTIQILNSIISPAIVEGTESVNKILKSYENDENMSHIIGKYHGRVIDIFTCSDGTEMAVELAAGKKLYAHVVDTHEVATAITLGIEKKNLSGKCTFFSIDRLYSTDQQYIDHPEAEPLVNRIQYDPKYEKVIKFVFGKFYLCKELQVADYITTTFKFNCITFEGDVTYTNGLIAAGYFRDYKSHIKLNKSRNNMIPIIDNVNEKLIKCRENIQTYNRNIIECHTTKVHLEKKIDNCNATVDHLNDYCKSHTIKVNSAEELKIDYQKELAEIRLQIKNANNQLEHYRQELTYDFNDNLLTADESRDYREYTNRCNELDDEIRNITQIKLKIQAEIANSKQSITYNSGKERDILADKLLTLNVDRQKRDIELLEYKSQMLYVEFNEITAKLDEVNMSIDNNILPQLKEHQSMLPKLTKAKKRADKYLFMTTTKMTAFPDDTKSITDKIEKAKAAINNIPPLSSDPDLHLSNLDNKSEKRLYEMLRDIESKLRSCGSVNVEAAHQSMTIRDKLTTALMEKEKLDFGYTSIESLQAKIQQSMETKLYNAINEVSKNFTSIFKRFVPDGNASMMVNTCVIENDNTDGEEDNDNLRFNESTGIEIKVSFTDSENSVNFNELSGGQRSLIALIFIFALHKYQPMPFYLFDEIDHALDRQYRCTAAKIISEMSQTSQFLIATFKPELLEYGKNFFSVEFENLRSLVRAVDKNGAIEILQFNNRDANNQ